MRCALTSKRIYIPNGTYCKQQQNNSLKQLQQKYVPKVSRSEKLRKDRYIYTEMLTLIE
jgi:hypothetical protein